MTMNPNLTDDVAIGHLEQQAARINTEPSKYVEQLLLRDKDAVWQAQNTKATGIAWVPPTKEGF